MASLEEDDFSKLLHTFPGPDSRSARTLSLNKQALALLKSAREQTFTGLEDLNYRS